MTTEPHRDAGSKPIVRRATGEDIEAFSAMPGRPTMKAWVGEIDGRIVGIGGLAFSRGRWVAFCDLTEEARPHKLAIVRAARAVMREARRAGHKFIHAEADTNEPMARRWLESLGFERQPGTGLYRWRP